MTPEHEDAYELVGQTASTAALVITCEHASQRLPERYCWPESDRWVVDTHWAFDLGAAALAEQLAIGLNTVAVLSRYTRLLIDPNRPVDSPTLCLGRAEGRSIELNRGVTQVERQGRIERYYQPYHDAVDRAVVASPASTVLAMHTFTSVYEGQRRSFEVGVLFDREETLALRLAEHICAAGPTVRLNEPYSGKGGYIYSVDLHAQRHGRRAMEIEVRQDRATDPDFQRVLVGCLSRFAWEQ